VFGPQDHVIDPDGDGGAGPAHFRERLRQRAGHRLRYPGRRRIAGVFAQRRYVDVNSADSSRKRECAARRAGAGKRDRAEDAESGAAHDRECGPRNLGMRASARCAEGPRAVYDVAGPLDESQHVTEVGESARRQPVPWPSPWLGGRPPMARSSSAEGRNARAHERRGRAPPRSVRVPRSAVAVQLVGEGGAIRGQGSLEWLPRIFLSADMS
jgi:hypothetical protein